VRSWARRATSLLASLIAVGLVAFGAYLLLPAAGYIVAGVGILLLDFADGGL
jgi:hypothetical protein